MQKYVNQCSLKLHTRFETFKFLTSKLKGEYVHVIKLDKSLHLKELQQANLPLKNPTYCKERMPKH